MTVALLPDGFNFKRLDLVKKNYVRHFKNWKPTEEGHAQIAGQKSYFLGGRFQQAEQKIQNLQFFISGHEKRSYVVTFTALIEDYPQLRSDFLRLAQSIETLEK